MNAVGSVDFDSKWWTRPQSGQMEIVHDCWQAQLKQTSDLIFTSGNESYTQELPMLDSSVDPILFGTLFTWCHIVA